MTGRPQKEFQEYLTTPSEAHVGHEDYLQAPATAFLKYTLEAKDAVNLCVRQFPRKKNLEYNKAASDSLQHIVSAMLPSLMGHFETFQRYVFAGVFDRSIYLQNFNTECFFKKLSKATTLSLDPIRLSAHRHLGLTSVGLLLADSLPGWHNPRKVNAFFSAFGLNRQVFSEQHCDRLQVLWQLRHSIVHTGGTLTLADSQKVRPLSQLGDTKVIFENQFIFEVARKMHPLVKDAMANIEIPFMDQMIDGLDQSRIQEINAFFRVESATSVWFT